MRVTQPADELEALFKELVLEPASPRRDRSSRQVPDILEGVFSRLVLERRALRDVRGLGGVLRHFVDGNGDFVDRGGSANSPLRSSDWRSPVREIVVLSDNTQTLLLAPRGNSR